MDKGTGCLPNLSIASTLHNKFLGKKKKKVHRDSKESSIFQWLMWFTEGSDSMFWDKLVTSLHLFRKFKLLTM